MVGVGALNLDGIIDKFFHKLKLFYKTYQYLQPKSCLVSPLLAKRPSTSRTPTTKLMTKC